LISERDASPFKRGVMLFDDYNYELYNKKVLPDLQELIDDEGDFESEEFSAQHSDGNSVGKSEDEGEEEKDNETNKSKEERRKAKLLEKGLFKKRQEDDNEDPFTLHEIKEIHYRQQLDPFEDINQIKNSAKLDYLNLGEMFSIKDEIIRLIPERMIQRGMTMATSSRRDDETEIGLINKRKRISVKDEKDDNESVETSNRNQLDTNHLDVMPQSFRADVETSYANLLKDRSGLGDNSESDDDEIDNTNRQFKSIDLRKLNKSNDIFSKITKGFVNPVQSAFSYREEKPNKSSTPKGSTIGSQVKDSNLNISSNNRKRLLDSEMEDLIDAEIKKEDKKEDKLKIVKKNTKKFLDEQRRKEAEDIQMNELLD
jgi:hypothetical protein